MANDVKYIEGVGDMMRLQYVDGRTVFAYPNGRNKWTPLSIGGTTPPVDPPVTGEWTHPLPGATMTSGYGPRGLDGYHYGTDLATTGAGDPVRALTALVITKATDNDTLPGYGSTGAGTHVKGHTLDGAYTFSFFHMVTGSLQVSVGQTVAAGTVLGTEGATGNVTGQHVHVEGFNGNHADPWVPTLTPFDMEPFMLARGVVL
jgi:Membrane proteins related to metalloendopeptidases